MRGDKPEVEAGAEDIDRVKGFEWGELLLEISREEGDRSID